MSDKAQKSAHDPVELVREFRRPTTADETVWAVRHKLDALEAEIARLNEEVLKAGAAIDRAAMQRVEQLETEIARLRESRAMLLSVEDSAAELAKQLTERDAEIARLREDGGQWAAIAADRDIEIAKRGVGIARLRAECDKALDDLRNCDTTLALVEDDNERLRKALVLAAIPHEALVADRESRKWIAPSIWVAMEEAVAAIRAALEVSDE